jgi:predicted ATPase/class 3 adenylate cyclase
MRQVIPAFILQRYAAGETTGRLSAAALFADVSGFSAMTDSLMEHGQHGAEVLATVMRTVFDPLVASVYEQGGFVASFAGDAFTALFPIADGHSMTSTARHALAAAWSIQERMAAVSRQDTPYGLFEILVKVGLDLGWANWGIVNSDDGRRAAYYFQGPVVDGSAEAEKGARAGEIVSTVPFYKQIAAVAAGEPAGSSAAEKFRLTSITAELPAPQPIDRPAAKLDSVARFVPREIITQVHGGEFRQAISLFISLPTVRTEAQLAIFIKTLFSGQDHYGGFFNRLDFGDKGANLLLFWGAPLAFENDVERALNFILDLQSQTAVPISAGITSHIAHAGFIGSELREEYTCYGRGTNLAARFMTAAPRGEIWVDENIAWRARAHFDIEFVEERSFKGFAQAQKVYALFERGETDTAFYEGELVGRERELQQLADFERPLFDGHFGGVLVILGEPGAGKSRLAHEFFNRDRRADPRSAATGPQRFLCQTDEILRESLNPFRYWLKQYFGISEGLAESRNKRSFNRQIDRLIEDCADHYLASELDRTRSFLAALVGLHWPDSLYEQLDGQSRYENTFTALISLLRAESREQPVVLFIEDSHWLDDDSKAFLVRLVEALAINPYPLAILATARLESTGLPLREIVACQEIELAGLPREALASLAAGHLKGPIAPPLLDLLERRAEGNPFFAEQIMHYMEEEGLLEHGEDGWQATMVGDSLLPADVRTMLVARLDRLSHSVREVVQTAAVLGREFEVRLLTRMLGPAVSDLQPLIEEAEHRDIWSTLSQLRYIFKHALLRDAAYRMQVRTRRQELHALALDSLERLYADDLSPAYGELAHHAEQARLVRKALGYLLLAGDEAGRNYANAEAISYYDRALEIGGRDQLSGQQLIHLYLSRGRGLEHTGAHEKALEQYEELTRLAAERQDEGMRLSALVAIGTLRSVNTSSVYDPSQAQLVADQGLVLARSQDDKAAEAKIYWHLMHLEEHLGEAGDSQRAVEYGEASLALARELNLREQIALTLNSLWMSYTGMQQISKATAAVAEAQRLFQETGNLPMLADAYNGSAGLLHALGQYQASLAQARYASQIAVSIGNVWNQVYAANILGVVYLEQGEIGQAIAELEKPRRLEGVTQLKAMQVYSDVFLAEVYLELGAIERAIPLCQAVADVTPHLPFFLQHAAVAVQARFQLLQGDATAARQLILTLPKVPDKLTYLFASFVSRLALVDIEVALALGNDDLAGELADELVEVADKTVFRFFAPGAHYLQSQTLLRVGNIEAAGRSLARAYQEAIDIGNRRMLWKILAAQAELAPEPAQAERLFVQAREILTFIAENVGAPERRHSFLNLPGVRKVMLK